MAERAGEKKESAIFRLVSLVMTEIYLVEKIARHAVTVVVTIVGEKKEKKKEYRSSMQVAKKLTRLLRYDEMVFFFFFFTLSNVQIVSFHRFERDFVNVLLNV